MGKLMAYKPKYTRAQTDRMIDALIEMSAFNGFWSGTHVQGVGREILRQIGRGGEVDAVEAREIAYAEQQDRKNSAFRGWLS